ncbi:hypothetical protein [Catellatospora chokoriensis]|nr:hypothetical protein [Catellatospora chokoriensis]
MQSYRAIGGGRISAWRGASSGTPDHLGHVTTGAATRPLAAGRGRAGVHHGTDRAPSHAEQRAVMSGAGA